MQPQRNSQKKIQEYKELQKKNQLLSSQIKQKQEQQKLEQQQQQDQEEQEEDKTTEIQNQENTNIAEVTQNALVIEDINPQVVGESVGQQQLEQQSKQISGNFLDEEQNKPEPLEMQIEKAKRRKQKEVEERQQEPEFEGFVCCPSRIQRICYAFLVIFYSGALILLSFINYNTSPSKSYNEPYKQLIDNLQQNMLSKISLVPGEQSCPTGQRVMLEFAYPGTSEGCDCNPVGTADAAKDVAQIFGETCSGSQSSCKVIQSIVEKNLNDWSMTPTNFLDTVRICGLFSNKNFLETSSYQGQCPPREKLCGGSDNEFRTCIPEDQDCPINAISFDAQSENKYTKIDYTKVSDKSVASLYFSSSEQATPISILRVSQGNAVCRDRKKNHYEAQIKQHPVQREQPSTCEKDDNFKLINSINQGTFLLSNGLQNDFVNIPKNNLILNTQTLYSIFTRSFFQWKEVCRSPNMKKDLVNYKDRFDGVKLGQLALILGSCVYFVCVAFFLGIYFFRVKKTQVINIPVMIVKVILVVALGVLIYVVFVYTLHYSNFLDEVVEKKCSDAAINEDFSKLNQQIKDKVLPINLIIFLTFNVALIFELIVFVVGCFRNKRIDRQAEQDEMRENEQHMYENGENRNDNVENYYTGDTLTQFKQQESYFHSVQQQQQYQSQENNIENNQQFNSIYSSVNGLLFQSIQPRPKYTKNGKIDPQTFMTHAFRSTKYKPVLPQNYSSATSHYQQLQQNQYQSGGQQDFYSSAIQVPSVQAQEQRLQMQKPKSQIELTYIREEDLDDQEKQMNPPLSSHITHHSRPEKNNLQSLKTPKQLLNNDLVLDDRSTGGYKSGDRKLEDFQKQLSQISDISMNNSNNNVMSSNKNVSSYKQSNKQDTNEIRKLKQDLLRETEQLTDAQNVRKELLLDASGHTPRMFDPFNIQFKIPPSPSTQRLQQQQQNNTNNNGDIYLKSNYEINPSPSRYSSRESPLKHLEKLDKKLEPTEPVSRDSYNRNSIIKNLNINNGSNQVESKYASAQMSSSKKPNQDMFSITSFDKNYKFDTKQHQLNSEDEGQQYTSSLSQQPQNQPEYHHNFVTFSSQASLGEQQRIMNQPFSQPHYNSEALQIIAEQPSNRYQYEQDQQENMVLGAEESNQPSVRPDRISSAMPQYNPQAGTTGGIGGGLMPPNTYTDRSKNIDDTDRENMPNYQGQYY